MVQETCSGCTISKLVAERGLDHVSSDKIFSYAATRIPDFSHAFNYLFSQ